MSRESTYPGHLPIGGGSQSQSQQQQQHQSQQLGNTIDLANLPPSYLTLLQKQQEYSALQALIEASGEMMQRIEKLAEMSNIMADGGEALGQVLRNWPHVFSVLNLVDKPVEAPTSPGGTAQEEETEPIPALIRLPYTEDPAK